MADLMRLRLSFLVLLESLGLMTKLLPYSVLTRRLFISEVFFASLNTFHHASPQGSQYWDCERRAASTLNMDSSTRRYRLIRRRMSHTLKSETSTCTCSPH